MSFIELSKIAGLSKFNARQEPDSGPQFDELCDSIREKGVTQPLTLRVEEGENRVLDGGRRLQALLRLREEGDFAEFNVPAAFFEGSDEEAAELSLISFVQRRDLHPVDEFERFVELRDRFVLDEAAIAKRTGKSLRFVKQRLRLARLAPAVRQAWRDGRLTAEQAQAFSATDNVEAQEALLADPNKRHWSAKSISRHLCGDGVIASDDRRARFVGLDAYAAAGGRLDEQLFEEDAYLFDEAILDRLARERLEAEADRLCRDEGWGWYETDYTSDDPSSDFEFFDDPDYLPEERARLDEIEDLSGDDDALARLEAEAKEIEARAVLRAVSRGDRATLGVFLGVSDEGLLEIHRAIRPWPVRETSGPSPRNAAEREVRPAGHSSATSAAPDGPALKIETFGKSTRAVLDEAASGALAEVTARNPRLALVFAVAALGCRYGADSICLNDEGWRAKADIESALLRAIDGEPFEKALAICARVELEDGAQVPIAFAELVGRNIHTVQAESLDSARVLIAVASRFCDVEGALRRRLVYEDYFKSEARGASIEAIRAIDGEGAAGEAAKLKKPELAKRAGLLARDRGWLPEALASALELRARDERSTAEAMRDAIEADLASDRSGPACAQNEAADVRLSTDAPNGERNERLDRLTAVKSFLAVDCFRGNDALNAGKIKASELYAAFVAYCEAREFDPLSLQEFGVAITELGVEKKRHKTGVHYLNLALRSSMQDKAA